MKRVSCDVIQDLIPLYVEDMLSEDSRRLVQIHLDECEECREYMDELQKKEPLPVETDTKPLKKIQSALRKKKWQTVVVSALITLLIGTLTVVFMTAPEYLPYSAEVVTVNEEDNGFVLAEFNEEVAEYDLERYTAESGTGSVYHLTTWTTNWHTLTNSEEVAPIVLNPSGEQVESVYYYETNETADLLIYGEDQHPNGGVITLPRLSLNYLSVAALSVFLVCAGIMYIVRSNKTYLKRLNRIIFLPLSYLLAQLIVTGWDTTTYSVVRDFTAILLVAILLYGIFWIGWELQKAVRSNKI